MSSPLQAAGVGSGGRAKQVLTRTYSLQMMGYLDMRCKRRLRQLKWSKQWFSLENDKLRYAKYPQKMTTDCKRIDCNHIEYVRAIEDVKERKHVFEIVTRKRIYILAADSEEQREDWLDVLGKSMSYKKKRRQLSIESWNAWYSSDNEEDSELTTTGDDSSDATSLTSADPLSCPSVPESGAMESGDVWHQECSTTVAVPMWTPLRRDENHIRVRENIDFCRERADGTGKVEHVSKDELNTRRIDIGIQTDPPPQRTPDELAVSNTDIEAVTVTEEKIMSLKEKLAKALIATRLNAPPEKSDISKDVAAPAQDHEQARGRKVVRKKKQSAGSRSGGGSSEKTYYLRRQAVQRCSEDGAAASYGRRMTARVDGVELVDSDSDDDVFREDVAVAAAAECSANEDSEVSEDSEDEDSGGRWCRRSGTVMEYQGHPIRITENPMENIHPNIIEDNSSKVHGRGDNVGMLGGEHDVDQQ